MIYAAILAGFCLVSITILFVYSRFLRVLDKKQAEIQGRLELAIRDWVEPQEENKPSKLAVSIDMAGTIIGSAAARSLMHNLSQANTAMTVAANNASEQITAAQNPLGAMLANLGGGKRGKGAAVARLVDLLVPLLRGATGGDHGSHSSGGQQTFSL